MEIVWTRHAEERQKQWSIKRAITREDVEDVVRRPEQVVPGDRDVLIAQSKRNGGLIRVPFRSSKASKTILTLYWTSKVEKYWRTP